MKDFSKYSAIIIGAGDATGSALCKKFADNGYKVCAVRRPGNLDKFKKLKMDVEQSGGWLKVFGVDARDEESIQNLFKEVEEKVAPIDVVIFNPGANVFFSIEETTSRVFKKVWEMAAFGGFLTGREAAKYMKIRNHGSIFFTGASAGVKGYANSSVFAMGKFALRGLAQALARELHPKNIHIAHFVIDGGIRSNNRPERVGNGEDNMLDPDAIAETYLQFHNQHKSAWSWETELRPWVENF